MCQASYNTTYDEADKTKPYVVQCPSILSVLSSVAATKTSSTAETTSATATEASSPTNSMAAPTSSSSSTATAQGANAAPKWNVHSSLALAFACVVVVLTAPGAF